MNLSYARALRVHSHKYILLRNQNLHYYLLLNSMKIGWVQPRLEYQKKNESLVDILIKDANFQIYNTRKAVALVFLG